MASAQQGLELIAPLDYTPDKTSINIDIIAVPGLGADPSKSFGSETPGGFNWLKNESEGIRSDIPGARVLLYHYESRWLGAEAKQQTLYNVASLLLDSLVEKRKGGDGAESTRPIVFLAHSMGGLVVAKALTLAAAHPENIGHMRIFECFAGGIFFGTPFRGSSAQARAVLLATFLEKVGRGIPTQMMQLLEPGRDSLEELRRDFVNLTLKEPKANLACIYEQAKTNYLQEKVSQWVPKGYFKVGPEEIVVTEESATIDGAVVRGVNCNHRQLNRFDNAKDGRYEVTRHHLKDIVKHAQLVVKARLRASKQSVVDDNTFSRLSDSLNVVNFQLKRKAVENLSGDSTWILQEQKYLSWSARTGINQPTTYPSLWVSGDEGLGKSKAALAVVDDIRKREVNNHIPGAKNVMVAYFFCDPTPDCSTAENVLKSLIWQLILKRRSLAQYVKTFAGQDPTKTRGGGGSGTEGQFSLSKLWKGLTEMLRDPSVHEVYFVLSNIHYISGDHPSTAAFLEAISEILATQPGSDDPLRDKVRWMFLSRDRPNIRAVLQEGYYPGALRIDLNDGTMSNLRRQHLRSYTRDEVKSLALQKGYSLALQYFVFSSLEKRAESNTLWVEVVCRLLGELPTNFASVRKKLELLPQDPKTLINRAWAEELKDAEKEDLETIKEILRTLVIAYEDPTLSELAVLAELDVNLDGDDSGGVEEKILEHIRACGPLLRVYDTDSWDENTGYRRVTRVTFIHPLARDALLTPELSTLIGLTDDNEKLEVKWQHGIVGLRCFSYMINELGTTEDANVSLQRTEPTAEDQAEAEIDELFPEEEEEDPEDDDLANYALEYPLKYWLRHGYEATPDFVETLDIKQGFWSLDSTSRKRWWGSYAQKELSSELKGMTALHVASYFGLLPLVDSLLADGHEDEIRHLDSWFNQPLHWAAARGHIKVCKRLMQRGSDINNGRETGKWTPLHMAASEDQVEVMHLLIESRADINALTEEFGTALSLALTMRQTKAAELLLDYGADATLAGPDSEPPLAVAALQGYETLVDKLLQLGASANLTSKEYGSALAAAASAGNLTIVNKLLALDTDWASRQRALEEASSAGFANVVHALLGSSAGLHCDKAFVSAAFYGHLAVAQSLWAYHQHYNVITPDALNTALYQATDAQQDAVVTFLLQSGANPNALGEEYGNALTASAFDGTTAILRTLIQWGAIVDAPEGYPLQTAAFNGHTEIVQILLDHGANPNAYSTKINPGTALQAACVVGNTDIARILIAKGAHPDYGAGDFSNPLTGATSNGHGEIVELLLQARANPNVFGGQDGSTPLVNACLSLQAKYIDLLVRYGAVVDQKDPDEDTPLIVSALVGDSECVKVLLNYRADINLGGKHHGSALHAAASRGHVETCKLLLENGAAVNKRGGPYDSVLQAAAASGSSECVKLILANKKVDINAQGGQYFTALHAAAVQEDDGSLRQLLTRGAKVNVIPPKSGPQSTRGTPLHAAAFAGCNRNARLLLEAGADPNLLAGKHGTVLQVAALKCDGALCALLIADGAKVDGKPSGKYGSALTAAVAREDDMYHQYRLEVVSLLLTQEGFPGTAFKAALEMALKLGRKEDFKLILASMKTAASKNVKNFPNIKSMLTQFKKSQLAAHQAKHTTQTPSDDDVNSDFGDDVINWDQDIDDGEEQQRKDAEALESEAGAERARGLGGSETSLPIRNASDNRSRGFGGGGNSGGGASEQYSGAGQQDNTGNRGFSAAGGTAGVAAGGADAAAYSYGGNEGVDGVGGGGADPAYSVNGGDASRGGVSAYGGDAGYGGGPEHGADPSYYGGDAGYGGASSRGISGVAGPEDLNSYNAYHPGGQGGVQSRGFGGPEHGEDEETEEHEHHEGAEEEEHHEPEEEPVEEEEQHEEEEPVEEEEQHEEEEPEEEPEEPENNEEGEEEEEPQQQHWWQR
ncbi:ankyrin repeat-containing domain protein [Lasiosphaeria hispida]|uniref:Ankyrin repeat-containing domain protein n=1 Tax=Lasiosphaeria hispida TaxID=260671 RepID=A0AAJ0HXA8_9PEZI|nr:ankyrin repeat-containing domain protein [Lasiosphaeria hispida]